MNSLQSVSQKFSITIVAVSVLAVTTLAFVLQRSNAVTFNADVSSMQLHSLVDGNTAAAQYLEDEKDFEAHFITIANLVKQDTKQELGSALLLATVPIILMTALIGYAAARYLLTPVKEAYQSQERFMQDAAHELRNPLAAMSLAIENADHAKKQDPEFVTTMKRQTKRLIRINEDLLYLERRTPAKQLKRINISELLEDVLEDLHAVAAKGGITFSATITPNIYCKIDPKDFIKLSRNILENAIKYAAENTQVTVSLMHDKNISFVVKDQGIGIPKSELAHIGERFYRATNTAEIDGTGLGIAIVKKVLNVYGGSLDIASKKDRGTTVTVSLK